MSSLIFYLVFFLSGFSALVYELIWTRKLALIFGNTPYAVSTVLAIFFSGLAIGSFLGGKLLSRLITRKFTPVPEHSSVGGKAQKNAEPYLKSPLLLYGFIELGIGILALATLPLIPLIDHLPLPPTLSPLAISSIILAITPILLPPTILIGATLPAMIAVVREFSQKGESMETLGQITAKVYAVNTVGGVVGAFLTAFFLITLMGVNQTLLTASMVNIAIGATLFFLLRKPSLSPIQNVKFKMQNYSTQFKINGNNQNSPPTQINRTTVASAFFLSGAAALSLEILLTRSLILSFGSSTYSFATVLTTFLLGIALGSALATKWLRYQKKKKDPLTLFSVCLVVISIITLLGTPIIGNLPLIFLQLVNQESSFFYIQSLIFGLSLVLILPATTFMGATFPLVVEAYQKINSKFKVRSSKLEIESVGLLYGINTLGGIIGSLLTGFVLIGTLGVQKSIIVTVIVYLLTGSVLLFYGSNKILTRGKVIVATTLTLAIAFLVPSWNEKVVTLGSFIYFPRLKSQTPPQIRSQMAARKLLFYKDGLLANVAVYEEEGERFLRLNGKTDASTGDDLDTELLIGHLPMLLAHAVKDVLVIGYGAGLSLGAVKTYPAEKIDVVEIEPAVIEAAEFFEGDNHNALSDPRVNLVISDGRNFLAKVDKSYDVITAEPSNPWISGIASLFTVEFFEEAKKHLKDDGVMLQWIHLYSLSPSDLSTVLKNFAKVFPHVSGWSPLISNDLLLIGSKTKHTTSLDQLEQVLSRAEIKEDLARIGISTPASLLRHYLLSQESIVSIAKEGQLHTDNHPLLEFSAPRSLWRNTVTENLKLLFKNRAEDFRQILPEDDLSEELKKQIVIRDGLLSGLIVQPDNTDRAIDLFEKIYELIPDDPQLKSLLADLYFAKAEELFIKGELEDSSLYLIKSIGLEPNRALAHANLGALYLKADQLDLAKQEFDLAVQLSPDRTEPHINLALYYQQLDNQDKARDELKKVLKIDPQNRQAQEILESL